MPDYIDRHALKNDGHICLHDGKGNVYYEVDHAPAVDVVEVRHGVWVQDDYINQECSVCGFVFDDDMSYEMYHDCYTKPNYYPNCGAKMDGKGDGNDKVL